MRIEVSNPEEVAKECFWLAWQAAGGLQGMGILQNRPQATREEVWLNVRNQGDYPKLPAGVHTNLPRPTDAKAYGDYVFGRMLKLQIKWDATSVTVPDSTPRADYQSWCHQYPTYAALVEAASQGGACQGEG